MVNGEFVRSSEEKYEISPDRATMATTAETRGFDDNEAATLHHLLDVLSLYCAESVVWWDEGQGTPLPPGAKPAGPHHSNPDVKTPDATGQKPVKVGEPPRPEKPKTYHVPDADYVAQVIRVK